MLGGAASTSPGQVLTAGHPGAMGGQRSPYELRSDPASAALPLVSLGRGDFGARGRARATSSRPAPLPPTGPPGGRPGTVGEGAPAARTACERSCGP